MTERPGVVELRDRAEPTAPPVGHTLVRIEAVGICGSDLHLYRGDLGPSHDGLLPRVQGHEVSAVVAATGPAGPGRQGEAAGGAAPDLGVGDRVAIWPVIACGRCRMCGAGRANVCRELQILGVHRDGALQDLLVVPTANLVATPGLSSTQAALAEPASVAVHAVHRGRVTSGECVVVLGAGPIGATSAVAARDLGADVVVVDPVASRRRTAAALGFETVAALDADARAADTGPDGPHVVIDTTGRAAVLGPAVEAVGHGGRLVVVGLTSETAEITPGPWPIKELDIVGVSCCLRNELAEAVDLLLRHPSLGEELVSHVLPLDAVADGFDLLARHPDEACKVLIDLRDSPATAPPQPTDRPGGTAR